MENLNKENFWDSIYKKYPKGVQIFCDWIDKYKEENNWHRLFKQEFHAKNLQVKFHDLPLAMQIGIWIEFKTHIQSSHLKWKIEDLKDYDWRYDIDNTLGTLHFMEVVK